MMELSPTFECSTQQVQDTREQHTTFEAVAPRLCAQGQCTVLNYAGHSECRTQRVQDTRDQRPTFKCSTQRVQDTRERHTTFEAAAPRLCAHGQCTVLNCARHSECRGTVRVQATASARYEEATSHPREQVTAHSE